MSAGARAGAETYPDRLRQVAGVVFDTDGVIIDSVRLHAAAWKTAFDTCLEANPPGDPSARRPFSTDDYLRYVDGRARMDGAASFLASRGLTLPPGTLADPPGTDTVGAVAARKEQLFTERIRARDVEAYPGTLLLLRHLRDQGIGMAAVSASRHARELLDRSGVLSYFTAVIDGGEATRLGLPGKPAPDLFLAAAGRLGLAAARTAVIEDALAGVEAGRRGRFHLVVGVDRSAAPDTRAALLDRGADVVVDDLSELLTDPTED
ncbi:HAD-IA family hydrolase [Streptomyces finlayi]|uniref:HAD-IA family hydrolase n=1 Tax=Streptomyces finlayi TaxID=67296 RepID=A0A7G7BD95_9ACTN|nr:HAD-IA family hydrolase [Streptomyces finlayi]QNE73310.1 HAD-IA family hydrolase [Streptomyces finlayi]